MLNITNFNARQVYLLAFCFSVLGSAIIAGSHIAWHLTIGSLTSLTIIGVTFTTVISAILVFVYYKAKKHAAIIRGILDEISDVIVVKDYDGNFVYCNETVAKLYQSSPEKMLGKDDFAFTGNQEQADFFRQNVQAIMDSRQTKEILESSTDSSNGETRHFKSIKIPYLDGQSQPKIAVVAKDITDLVSLKEEADRNKKHLFRI